MKQQRHTIHHHLRRRQPLPLIKIFSFEMSFLRFTAALLFLAVAKNLMVIWHDHHHHRHDARRILLQQENGPPSTVTRWLRASSKMLATTADDSTITEAAAENEVEEDSADKPTTTNTEKSPYEILADLEKQPHQPFTGSLQRNNTEHRRGPQKVHIVVSHCVESIKWFFEETLPGFSTKHHDQFMVDSITILSKCGHEIPPEDLEIPCSLEAQPRVALVTLPNKGRNDHSFSYWISSVLAKDPGYPIDHGDTIVDVPVSSQTTHGVVSVSEFHDRCGKNNDANNDQKMATDPFHKIANTIDKDDLVVFMKDNNNMYRNQIEAAMPLHEILEQTLHNNGTTYELGVNTKIAAPSFPRGVACGSIPHLDDKLFEWTSWAHRSILWTFQLDSYSRKQRDVSDHFLAKHRPMGNWILHLASLGLSSGGDDGNNDNNDIDSDNSYKGIFSDDYLRHAIQRFDPGFVPPEFNATKSYKNADIVPICFGGVFATQWGQISSRDAAVTLRGWKAIVAALTREDNLEEGHYMERWWMDILSWSSYNRDNWGTASGQHRKEHGTTTTRAPYSPKRTSTVSSPQDQRKLLTNKAGHFAHPSPYAGVILLYTQQMRQRSAIMSGWEMSRKTRERKQREKEQHLEDTTTTSQRRQLKQGEVPPPTSSTAETKSRVPSDLDQLREAKRAAAKRERYWERD